jgi:hypothetical protein
MEESNWEMCFDYFKIRLANGLAMAEEKGYPYLLVYWDIINENGMAKPVYEQAYIKDLNHIFRLVKTRDIDINVVTIFDVSTGEEVDKAIFRKGK